jgi:hypothetical protein
VRGIQDTYYKADQNDYIVIFAVCAGLTAVAGAIIGAISFGLFLSLIIALPAGGVIAEAALRVTERRRGRQSANIAAAGAVVGGLIGGVVQVVLWYNSIASQVGQNVDFPPLTLNLILQRLTSDFGLLLFVGLVAAAVYGRFKMRS